jgi:hypothetical protein
MTTAQERAEFIAVLSRELSDHSVGAVSELANKLMKSAREYDGIQTRACNGEERPLDAKRETGIEERTKELLDVLGIGVQFGGDPRGYTVKLQLKSGRSNTWGNDGWGVPCS